MIKETAVIVMGSIPSTSESQIRKLARICQLNGANAATLTNNVHLPSDARQKLEKLVI